jgi:hypothetical protein
MPITVERLSNESIIIATSVEPLIPEQDVPAMFSQFTSLRLTISGDVVLILDFGLFNDPQSFSKLVRSLAEASQGIRVSRAAGVARPPITIFVGSGPMVAIASEAMGQEQYGGVRRRMCSSLDEAITLARSLLTS